MNKEAYKLYLKSQHWIKIREQKLFINNKCQGCGSKQNLQCHHINYFNLYKQNPWTDLITVCRDCHQQLHQQYNKRSKQNID